MKRSKVLRVSKEGSFTQLQPGTVPSSSLGFNGISEFDDHKPGVSISVIANVIINENNQFIMLSLKKMN